MTYEIIIDKEAIKALKKLPKQVQARITKKIEDLKENPRPEGAKALQGGLNGLYRIRIGDYRVIYKVENEVVIIYVLKIAHRKSVYNG